ncbi:MAG TPA: glycine betaine ABC transporter substrate-binding protein [Gemmatimonadales bacterium]|jgi:osmoprotectant transport system permease protein|nr:glycine betaine ABC transporter substrate-binding protein [Gemmatimonadales bacterium]
MSAASLLLLLAVQAAAPARPVVVASKPFGESYLLAEMFAQLLEARGIEVDRRPGLGATEIAFRAIRTGSADVYPEYTGTGLLAILGEQPATDPRQVFDRVSREFHRRWNARWLPPLGFENTYAIAVRRETAEQHGLAALSDLARVSASLRAGLTADFIGRADGLPGLTRAYGVRFAEVRALLPAVKYQALAAGEVDVIDGYSTDGLIARYDLVVLRDDQRFFPPYEAAALVSGALVERQPAAVAALTELSGRLNETAMRRLNRRLEVDREPVGRIAGDALAELGLIGRTPDAAVVERSDPEGLTGYLWARRSALLGMTGRHLLLVALSLAAAIAVAVPAGLALERVPRGAEAVVRGVGLLQTMPGIALLAFMIPLAGIGVLPAVIALFLYSLYPILRNTFTGVRDSAPDAVAAGRALGMTPRQILRHVRLPLAAPVIMAGIRTAAVINVGTTTLAAFIGAGGLGDPIAAGLALSDTRMILSGAIPAALLALGVDGLLGAVERRVSPGGQPGRGATGPAGDTGA